MIFKDLWGVPGSVGRGCRFDARAAHEASRTHRAASRIRKRLIGGEAPRGPESRAVAQRAQRSSVPPPLPHPPRPAVSNADNENRYFARRAGAARVGHRPDARHRRQPQGAQVLVGAPRQRHARGPVENPVAARHLARVQRRRLASRVSTYSAPGAPGDRGRRPARTPRHGRGRTGAAHGPGGGRGGAVRRVRLRGWR